ncbi:hypothetical protein FACS1894178_5910 [Bacteroidia bacterium]|nr:hypothetical protein FACS1894178_5910 [Bacteroidia bacterium]
MGKSLGFEDLEIWKLGVELSIIVYHNFASCKDFGFKDQIQRASVSVPSNIAEGYDRQTEKELVQFMFIAKASCAELRTQAIIAKNVNLITNEQADILINKSKTLSVKILNYIRYVQKKTKITHITPTLPNITQHYPTLPNITQRYTILPNVTQYYTKLNKIKNV